MSDLKEEFIEGMSQAASTVTIVATDGAAGMAGVTVSAMSSISADTAKPTLLVCVNQSSSAAEPIVENGVFSVNLLRDNQVKVSDVFAGRFGHSRDEKFSVTNWTTGETGAPLLDGALTSFDCNLVADQIVGTHHVFFGEVQQVRHSGRGHALVYASRSYRTISNIPAPFGSSERDETAARLACLNSIAHRILPDILERHAGKEALCPVEVWDSDQDEALLSLLTGDADLALIYDRDVPTSLKVTELASYRPYILLHDGHRLLDRQEIALQDLADDPLILLESPASRDYFLSVLGQAGVKAKVAMSVRSFELVRSLVARSLGYTILVSPPEAASALGGQGLHVRPIAGEVEPIKLVLAERPDVEPSQPVAALLKSICDNFGCN